MNVWERKDKGKAKVRQKQMQILHSIATAKGNSRFLHCSGKCAAFGRNDGGWVWGEMQLQLQPQHKSKSKSKKAKAKCRGWAVSAQLFAFRIAGDCLRPLHFLSGRFAKNTL
jgi:hypothetical protein